jgi:hypothetical protein
MSMLCPDNGTKVANYFLGSFYVSSNTQGGIMWSKDWIDVAVVISWISVWSALVYFIPVGGV